MPSVAPATTRVQCPNCHGFGWIVALGVALPCFVCDEDGTLEWDTPVRKENDSGEGP